MPANTATQTGDRELQPSPGQGRNFYECLTTQVRILQNFAARKKMTARDTKSKGTCTAELRSTVESLSLLLRYYVPYTKPEF